MLCLRSELIPLGGIVNDSIILFALQSAIAMLGSERVNDRCRELREYGAFVAARADGSVAAELSRTESHRQSLTVNLEDAALQFDGGESFLGSFKDEGLSVGGAASDAQQDPREPVIRRHVHLLIQLCLLDADVVESLFNLYGCAAKGAGRTDPWASLCTEGSPALSAAADDEVAGGQRVCALLCKVLETEFSNVLPSLTVAFPPAVLLAKTLKSDPLARKLYLMLLDSLQSNMETQATADTVAQARCYGALNKIYRQFPPAEAAISAADQSGRSRLAAAAETELLAPVASGLSTAEAVQMIPAVIDFCLHYYPKRFPEAERAAAGTASILTAFNRMVRSRPAPLTRAGLIYALHK
jgi:hypothetical protein